MKGRNNEMNLMLKIISAEPGTIDVKRTGRKMKEICRQKGIAVRTIQDALYIGSFQSVYAWFSGKTMPSLDNMYRLSRLLGVPMEELIVDSARDAWVLLEELVIDTGLEERVQIYYDRLANAAG